MLKKLVDFIANNYIREMLFAFIIVVIVNEYIDAFFVKILLFIIAFAIAIKPMFRKDSKNE